CANAHCQRIYAITQFGEYGRDTMAFGQECGCQQPIGYTTQIGKCGGKRTNTRGSFLYGVSTGVKAVGVGCAGRLGFVPGFVPVPGPVPVPGFVGVEPLVSPMDVLTDPLLPHAARLRTRLETATIWIVFRQGDWSENLLMINSV
ncbi:MAG: hypothetical protein Q4E66_06045, partial [Comamonadaceae bacterium]|nr:hypothetical protein [Comamonadaceae bacterium]